MKIVTTIIKIIAIILNASLLIWLICWVTADDVYDEVLWLRVFLLFVVPSVNLLAIALTFRRKDELIETRLTVGQRNPASIFTTILKIIAIVLNTIFLVCVLIILRSQGVHPVDSRDWAGLILMFTFPPVTLVTIALTFLKKMRMFTAALKIITIIVNACFLIIFICEVVAVGVNVEGFGMWVLGVLALGLPVVNVLAVALTFRKGKPIPPKLQESHRKQEVKMNWKIILIVVVVICGVILFYIGSNILPESTSAPAKLTPQGPRFPQAELPPEVHLFVAGRGSRVYLLQSSEAVRSLFYSGRERIDGLIQSRNRIFVADEENVTILDPSGSILKQIALPDEVRGFINFTVLPNDAIAVMHNGNNKVYFVDSDGKYLKSVKLLNPGPSAQNMDGIVVNNGLIISENGNNQILKIDLSSYEISIFKDLSHLGGTLSAIGYSNGTYYVGQGKKRIYSFTEESDTIRPLAELSKGNITSLVIHKNKAYISANFAGAVYEVDLTTGRVKVVKELHYPRRLALLLVR